MAPTSAGTLAVLEPDLGATPRTTQRDGATAMSNVVVSYSLAISLQKSLF